MTDLPVLLVIVRVCQNTFQGLHRQSASLLHRDAQVPHREHPLPVSRIESQLHLCLDLLLISHLGVMNECSSTSIRRLVSGCGILETLDDGGLTAAVVSDDHGYWGKELYDRDLFVVERPDAADCKLVQRSHRQSGWRSKGDGAVERAGANEVGSRVAKIFSHKRDSRYRRYPAS